MAIGMITDESIYPITSKITTTLHPFLLLHATWQRTCFPEYILWISRELLKTLKLLSSSIMLDQKAKNDLFESHAAIFQGLC